MSERLERVLVAVAFLGAAVALALGGFETLAATSIGAAAGYVMPRVPPGAVAGLGIAAGLAAAMAGCTPADGALAHKLTCDAVRLAGLVCDATSGGESE